MIICLDCGNTKKFKRIASYKEWSEEEHFFNGEDITEDAYEYGESDTVDSEFVEYLEGCTCLSCESENTQFRLKKIDVMKIQLEHLDNFGKWHKDGVDEEDQNIELRKKILAMEI